MSALRREERQRDKAYARSAFHAILGNIVVHLEEENSDAVFQYIEELNLIETFENDELLAEHPDLALLKQIYQDLQDGIFPEDVTEKIYWHLNSEEFDLETPFAAL